MGHPLKFFKNKEVYFVSSRTESGLPFHNAERYDPLFRSILARALSLYPVELIAFTLEANHLHLMVAAITPEHVSGFVGYVKQELAHLVNLDEGRVKRTIWCDGFDAPAIEEEGVILHYLMYIYTQSRSIRSNYCNSFAMLSSWQYSSTHARRNRQGEIVKPEESHLLTIDPLSWIKRLNPDTPVHVLRTRMMQAVFEARKAGEQPSYYSDSTEQSEQDKLYVPTKRGQRSYCIIRNKERRIAYLTFIKESRAKCREVLAEWRKGNHHIPWPPGFFPPSAIRRANVIDF